MNLVLYRKYRPKSFSEFIGQEHIVKTLTNEIKNNNLSHAYIFSGPRGTGKTTLARLFAKAVNCEERDGFEPCNKCFSCLEINSGRAMDLIEIDAASQTGVDNIRDLKEGIRFVPSRLKYKVFIIDESHQLSKAAANALLKTLEEPPAHAIFILATTEIHKMIPTILSRCQRFDFHKLSVEEIALKLERDAKEEGVAIERAGLELIARAARGSIRDGESFLDQVLSFSGSKKEITAADIRNSLGLIETRITAELAGYIFAGKAKEAINFLHQTLEKGLNPQEFCRAFLEYLHQGLIVKIGGRESEAASGLTKEEAGILAKQVETIKLETLSEIVENFLEAQGKIKYSSIPELSLELAILDSCEDD